MNIIYALVGSTIVLSILSKQRLMNESDILAAGRNNPRYWHSNVIRYGSGSKTILEVPNSWIDSNGGHIRSVGNLGLNQCRRQCQETPVCSSYCYDPERRWCYLRRQPNKWSRLNASGTRPYGSGSPPSKALVSRRTTCGVKL